MRLCPLVAAVALSAALGARAGDPAPSPRRPFVATAEGRWIGRGVAYGPHRDGQRPGGAAPTRAQLREDLALLRGRFELLRVYGSDAPTPELLALVREEHLPFRVLLGAWIEPETDEARRAANGAEVERAKRLANAYPDVVVGLVVGNETQVSWSDHRTPPDLLVRWLREARRGTTVPVSTADDFAFWLAPESAAIAREVDFLVAHIHPMWNGVSLDGALAFTQERYAEIARRHAGLPVVLGEAGWATRRNREGDQGARIRGEADEEPQRLFFQAFSAWVERERIPSAWFEAFDESWKGGPHPDDVEKHWGLFRADRTPKAAVRGR